MSAPIEWHKASCGGGNNCIEIARDGDRILMRESSKPDEVIVTTPAKLEAFILGIKAGEFDHFAE